MRCPTCNERVIDFAVWGQGINAFRKVECPSCGAKLRPSARTIILFFVLLIAMAPLIISVASVSEMVGASETIARIIFGFKMIPLAIAAAYWLWKTEYYSIRKGI
jgi:DNA-directed RNA polymerase subunit RPC12/RpoP